MLKLRYLFNNPDLAEMLVKNWEFDPASLDLFQYFRISANAIYPFKINGEICLLRGCPASEKPRQNLLAELAWIHYLREEGYPAMAPVPSKAGTELVQQMTPWGAYYASVFKRVPGQQLSEITIDDPLAFGFGAALGQLNRLSSEYTAPQVKRWAHEQVLNWIEDTLQALGAPGMPLVELNLLREAFSRLPKNSANYGLIHYDFELDNVFWDAKTQVFYVIDFDDAMYHWYMMDIEQTLNSLQSELGEQGFSQRKAAFLSGYRSKFPIDDGLFALLPLFRRFAALYRYARLARSLQEQWENEPEWLVQLRVKLEGLLVKDSAAFGQPVPVLPP